MRKFPKLLAVVLAIAIIICPAMCLSSMAATANTYSISYADDAITVNVSAETGLLVALLRLDVLGYTVDEDNIEVVTDPAIDFSANPDYDAEAGTLSLLLAAKEATDVSLVNSATVTVPVAKDDTAAIQYIALNEVQAADAGTAEAPESFLAFEGVGEDGLIETPVIADCSHIDEDADNLCDACGEELETVCEHVIGEVTSAQPATATETGKIYGICSDCGEACEADVEYYGNFKTAYAAAELASETSLLLSARNDRLAEKGAYDRALIYFQHTLSGDGSNKITIKDVSEATDTTQGSSNRPCKTWKYGVKSLQYTEAVINNVFVYAGGQWYNGEQITYSLRSYIDERLSLTKDQDEKVVCANLLAFGASMQTLRSYNTEYLATDGLSQDILDLIYEGDATMTDVIVEDKPADNNAVYINKYGFDMADKVIAMLYFRADRYTGANRDDYKIVATWSNARGIEKELVIRKDGSVEPADIYYGPEYQNGAVRPDRYTFNFDQLASYDFRQQVTFSFYDGETLMSTYTASYEALVKDSIAQGTYTGQLVTVANRLLHYSDAAKAYFCK